MKDGYTRYHHHDQQQQHQLDVWKCKTIVNSEKKINVPFPIKKISMLVETLEVLLLLLESTLVLTSTSTPLPIDDSLSLNGQMVITNVPAKFVPQSLQVSLEFLQMEPAVVSSVLLNKSAPLLLLPFNGSAPLPLNESAPSVLLLSNGLAPLSSPSSSNG